MRVLKLFQCAEECKRLDANVKSGAICDADHKKSTLKIDKIIVWIMQNSVVMDKQVMKDIKSELYETIDKYQ